MDISSHTDRLHRQAMTVNAHFDLTFDLANKRDRGYKDVIKTDYLPGFQKSCFDLIVSSIYIHQYFLPEMALRKALDQISYLLQEIDDTTPHLKLCHSATDIQQARQAGQTGIMLSFEGVEPLQNDIQLLRIFYELGLRGVGLTWSRRNYAGDGCFFKPVREGAKGGLTPFGVEVVETAEALGMVVDVSHLNDEGFWDVVKIAQRPVIASHSNCRAIVNTMRNLTDAQIEAIAKTGGVIGMNGISAFTGNTGASQPRLQASDLVAHVDHIVKIAGIEHVGMGFDFCDGFQNFLTAPENIDAYDVIDGHENLHQFTAALIDRGYTDEDILGILGGNFIRVFEAIL